MAHSDRGDAGQPPEDPGREPRPAGAVSDLLSLDVALLHVSGFLVQQRSLNLALRAGCVLFDNGAKGSGTVAEPKRGFVEFALADGDCRELCRAAEEAGLAERPPRVKEVADTSDRFAQVLLVVTHEKGSHTLQLNLMCSGYEGPDAPALQRFFALLLKCAGVRDGSILADLAAQR
jgi:hypothetical protein